MSARGLDAEAEGALREAAPRVLGALVKRGAEFAAAEDALQEALLAALVQWPKEGRPVNPAGWLFRVASRRVADREESERARREREDAAGGERALAEGAGTDDDDTLELLFTCCHAALALPAAIALTLRAVGGLTTAEIASAFLVPEATMAQRIQRAKQAIQASGVALAVPDAAERARRLAAVRHVLYLAFNEGYAASSGPTLVRIELCREALRLARLLLRLTPEDPETAGLVALMLLTDARRGARTGARGELVPLDEQDRTRWDRAAIAEGTALVRAAFARGRVGPYQLQAAIAAVHDAAARHADTDWGEILGLYGVLRRFDDNPVIALNQAVAHAMVHGPEAGLARLVELEPDERIARHHRLDAVRAHLLERLGRATEAIERYRAAAARTPSLAERDYLITRAARLAEASAP